MNRYQQQLCETHTVILNEDYALINEIIIDYVENLNDYEFDNVEEYVNNNLNEILH